MYASSVSQLAAATNSAVACVRVEYVSYGNARSVRSASCSVAADLHLLPPQGRFAHGGHDIVGGGSRYLDQRKAVGNLDRAELAGTDARLIRDRAAQIRWTNPGLPTGADEEPDHLFVLARPTIGVLPGGPCLARRALGLTLRAARRFVGQLHRSAGHVDDVELLGE